MKVKISPEQDILVVTQAGYFQTITTIKGGESRVIALPTEESRLIISRENQGETYNDGNTGLR
jgi:hypothetical protein